MSALSLILPNCESWIHSLIFGFRKYRKIWMLDKPDSSCLAEQRFVEVLQSFLHVRDRRGGRCGRTIRRSTWMWSQYLRARNPSDLWLSAEKIGLILVALINKLKSSGKKKELFSLRQCLKFRMKATFYLNWHWSCKYCWVKIKISLL